MKQKFKLNVSDIEINVVTEESKESVDEIVGIVDRRMREINRKGRLCSKTEAAVLCSLDLCAEKLKYQARIAELEADDEENIRQIEILSRKLEKRENDYSKIKKENDVMRDLLGANAPERKIDNDQMAIFTAPEQDGTADSNDSVGADELTKAKTRVQAKHVKNPSKAKNNKVGQMFDLLTFSDV